MNQNKDLNKEKIHFNKITEKLYQFNSFDKLNKCFKQLGYLKVIPDNSYNVEMGYKNNDYIYFYKKASTGVNLVSGSLKKKAYVPVYFRNKKSAIALQNLFLKANQFIHDFTITTNFGSFVDTLVVNTCCNNSHRFRELGLKNDQNIEFWKINTFPSDLDNDDKKMNYKKRNEGFPYSFPDCTKPNLWNVYIAWVIKFDNNTMLDKKNYFTGTWDNYSRDGIGGDYNSYKITGISNFYVLNEDHVNKNDQNGFSVNFGQLNFEKHNYYSSYNLILPENQISKLSSIKIESNK
jgi:hypothetical protein